MSGAALAIGAGIQAYGSYTSGMDKAAAYGVQAQQKRATAAEVQIGADRDITLVKEASARTSAAQQVAFGKSGVSVSSGSPLAVLEQSASQAFDQVQSIQQAATYREGTLNIDAQQSDILGQQAKTSAFLGVLGAGASAFSKNPYNFDQPVTGAAPSQGSILTSNELAPGVDSSNYNAGDYARLHYMNGGGV